MAGKVLKSKQKQKDIEHVILSLLDSGLSIFHHSFVEETIDPDLFSALITATSLHKRVDGYSTERIFQEQFQIEKYNAHVCQGEYLAGIIVTSSYVASEDLNRFLKFLALFEEENKFLIRNWHGDRTFFDQSWALSQLEESLFASEGVYRLVDNAMRKAGNARQIRLILLIQRYEKANSFSREHLIQLLEKELEIPSSLAEEYINELEEEHIISDSG